MSRRKKIIGFSFLGAAALLLLACAAAIVLLQSDWFKNKVREKIVAVAEQATGARVEIGRFTYNWRQLTAEVSPFVLHGTEAASAPPLLRADKIRVHLKIISLLEKKVDVSSLIFDNPKLDITVGPDGSTNVPHPKVMLHTPALVQQLLDFKVQHIELHHGEANYNSWKFPLDAAGDGLQISLRYESAGPRYLCNISSPNTNIASPKLDAPLQLALNSQIAFGAKSIQILSANLKSGGSELQGSGDLGDLSAPQGQFDLSGAVSIADLSKFVRLPIQPRGEIEFHGHASAARGKPYQLTAKIVGRELAYLQRGFAVAGVSLSGNADVTPGLIRLSRLELALPEGRFHGAAEVAEARHLSMKGVIDGVSIAEAGRLARRKTGTLSGTFSGPVELTGILNASGLADIKTSGDLTLKPGRDGVPVHGAVMASYDQRTGKVSLGNSQFSIGSSRAGVSGILGEKLVVHAVSRNLNDAIPVLRALGAAPPQRWPVELQDGVARVDASVAGSVDNPKIAGKAEVERLKMDGRQIDRIVATFALDKSALNLPAFDVQQGKMRLQGQGRAELRNWSLSGASPISGLATLRAVDLQTLVAETGIPSIPATGAISGTVRVSGSLDSPLLNGAVALENLTAYYEHFAELRAGVTFTPTALELSNGVGRNGKARVNLSGSYNHPANDWQDGSLRFDVATAGLDLAQIKHVQDWRPGLNGRADLKADGAAKIVSGRLDLTSLNGQVSVHNTTLDGQSYGDFELSAATHLPVLDVTARAAVKNYQLQGAGQWRLDGDYQGHAEFQIPRISFATMHELSPGPHLRKDLPFGGFLAGDGAITGPLNHPSQMKAAVTLETVQFNAGPNAHPIGEIRPQDLLLRNAEPIHLQIAGGVIDIDRANFIAKDTTLDASGRLALHSQSPWNLKIQGRINFSILELFNPDLLGSGASLVNVAIRGPLLQPQVEGRLDLQNVSLYLRDVPTGIDQANGVILFDRNRATIQNLTAHTGSGDISFEPGSFVGFRGAGLIYRLQAAARKVRYRSDNGISLTADGSLALVGTSDNSVLSGSVSVSRAAFSPQTDLGSLLASTAKPVAEASSNQYLNGVQLDVHIVTNRALEVDTALTRNIQAEADVRLRGTTDHPVLLGQITVNSGQIEFFGNKYTINRGLINFNNAARIQPNIDMDLSTRVRGITVDITFSGPLNKLNFSYRSDPPLEATDIIALLAVGRSPSTAGPLASPQTANNLNSNYLGTGSNSLLSQAISPNQGRLQKFFGVSHIKIDPQLTDITIVPQARLTMEQQVSSNITLTYIQNLAITNQQIVRVEWDFSRKWSAVALRDENGAFSIDILYRKRFK